jgi:Conjugal transfer protein TraD
MASNAHSTEQGLRVHYLTNLGGLVALAGLDTEPPDFLLGALLSIARETGSLGPEQRAEIAAMGQVKLDQRATGKRAWTSWNRARELHGVTLTSAQIRRMIVALGRSAPSESEALAPALLRTLEEVECDG